FYDEGVFIPREILVPEPLEDRIVVEEWLSEKRGGKVVLINPTRGEGRELLKMAASNAENVFQTERRGERQKRVALALDLMQEKLHLNNRPQRIECFDVSNIGGDYAVGSMVTFLGGVPHKDGYRRFRVKTVVGADDYGMMYEIMSRRYATRDDLPDLIVVDGGKGQLRVALSVLKDLRIEGVDVISLAKEKPEARSLRSRERKAGTVNRGEDRVYLPQRKDPLYLSDWPPVLFLLQQIRDEAHRFAISYHRRVKAKADLHSILDDIATVGTVKKKALLKFFGSLDAVKAASIEQLQKVPGVGRRRAERIHTALQAMNHDK
ncbi:MAG: helix-hairpin-helix domain-containing protein, partial [Smithellaceae bacterium]|nr:helix-hairpin-helix domain-containing protein [Smithellaceae bacterium]